MLATATWTSSASIWFATAERRRKGEGARRLNPPGCKGTPALDRAAKRAGTAAYDSLDPTNDRNDKRKRRRRCDARTALLEALASGRPTGSPEPGETSAGDPTLALSLAVLRPPWIPEARLTRREDRPTSSPESGEELANDPTSASSTNAARLSSASDKIASSSRFMLNAVPWGISSSTIQTVGFCFRTPE